MARSTAFPLDYAEGQYLYLERENRVLVELFRRQVLIRKRAPRVLDIGAGAGANVRALKALASGVHVTAVEPNARAAELAAKVADQVFCGTFEAWLASASTSPFDAVLLSDVVEHIENPVRFLRALLAHPAVEQAVFLVSVPNYAVWYNRLSTLAGRFEYAWSGLRDRTHLRFFTRASIRDLLEHVGLDVLEQAATPSLVQSAAPWLRRWFHANATRGEHLALERSRLFHFYGRFVEPLETRVCASWPELLGFQLVTAARKSAGLGASENRATV